MARFKKFRAKASRAFKRYGKNVRRPGTSANLMTLAISAAAYGAVRPKVEELINPYTSKIPLVGNYADEIVLGTVGYLLAKGKMPVFKGKVAKQAGMAILVLESARVGGGLAQGMMPSSTGASNFSSSSDWG